MTEMTNYAEIANSIADTIAKCSKPLSESQRLVLAGSVAVWMDKVRGMTEERARELIVKLESDDLEHRRYMLFDIDHSERVYLRGWYTPEELRAMADWVEKKHD